MAPTYNPAGILYEPRYRRVISDLAAGAVLVKKFGNYETYKEVHGRVLPCASKILGSELTHLQAVMPELTPLNAEDPEPRTFGLPAAHRNAWTDRLQQTMDLDDLVDPPEEDAPSRRAQLAET